MKTQFAMLWLAATTISLVGSLADTKPASSIEIRFCPASAVRAYPLESRRELNSLMLQNIAVLNRGGTAFKIDSVELQLLKNEQALEQKRLDASALERAASRGAKMQAAGILKQVAFQFCGDQLIPDSVKVAGPTLEHDQALLITSQAFVFNGTRDLVRVRAHGTVAGRATEISATIPVKLEFAKNTYIFPLRGVYYVGVGASFHTPHRWAIPEEFALDIARIGENGLSHRGDGTRFEDYYAYGADVLAAADGRVVAALNDEPEDASAMQKPNETQEQYFTRLQQEQAERMEKGSIAGNHVLIDHGQNEYSLSAHLQPGSVRVHKGDIVKAGDVIGKIGSSGNSSEPHLHFQLTDKGDSLLAAGIPLNFSNITIQWADVPRPLQSGDIVIAR